MRVPGHSNNITLTSLEDLRANTEEERAHTTLSGFAAQIHALQEDRRMLWDWTPPIAQGGPIAIDRMIDFAAEVLELHTLVLPKIISGSYPITFIAGGEVVARDANELKPVLTRRVAHVAGEADELFVLARAAAERATGLLAALEGDIADLVRLGREIAAEEPVDGAEGRLVTGMRAVGDSKNALRSVIPGSARHEIRAFDRWLIDHTYLEAAESRADWDTQEEQLGRFVGKIRVAIDDATHRTWHSPPAEAGDAG